MPFPQLVGAWGDDWKRKTFESDINRIDTKIWNYKKIIWIFLVN